MKILRIAAAALVAALSIVGTALAVEPTFGWSVVHDGGAGLDDQGVVVLADAAGNPIVGGMRTLPGRKADLLVRKFDRATGAVLWTCAYADPAENDMVLSDLVLDHRGDVLVAGYLSSCDS